MTGRLRGQRGKVKVEKPQEYPHSIYSWKVKNPINNYNIIPYIGKYVNWKETYEGEKGKLEKRKKGSFMAERAQLAFKK